MLNPGTFHQAATVINKVLTVGYPWMPPTPMVYLSDDHHLVGGLEHFFHILGIIIPTDEVHHFSEGLSLLK